MTTTAGHRPSALLVTVAVLSSLLSAGGCGARTSPGGLDGGSEDTDGGARQDADLAVADADRPPRHDVFVPDDPVYGAVGFATGLSRFAVFKRHRAGNTCAVVSFVSPMDDPLPELTLPATWSFERGWLGDAAACDRVSWPPARDNLPATGAAGWARWDERLCDIDLDVTLEFEDGQTERLRASGLRTDFAGCD